MSQPGEAETPEQFRVRIRSFLEDHHPGPRPRGGAERIEWRRRWMATLYDHGYAAPSWPRDVGGMEIDFGRQVVYHEEMARARVPAPLGTGIGIVGPTIVKFGSPEQKQRWLPPMLRGERGWVQGFSEPGAGSDLPALRTRAVRKGDHYVVTGHKVWTTQADVGDVMFTLVRTGTQESRDAGITYLMIDLHAPGVTVRTIKDIAGGTEFGEIFLDEVRVPVSERLGAENEGWPLVRNSLGHERAAGAMTQSAMYRRVLDELIELARSRELSGVAGVQDAFAEFEVRLHVMRCNAQRTIADIVRSGVPGPASSVSRLVVAAFEQDLHEFAVDLLGWHGVLDRDDPDAVQRSRWTIGFLKTRASTIGTGTSEIQRNTIAERILELPREPNIYK